MKSAVDLYVTCGDLEGSAGMLVTVVRRVKATVSVCKYILFVNLDVKVQHFEAVLVT